jgi:hypothetical protein
MTTSTRLATECLSVADALRNVRAALQKVVHRDPPELARLFPEIAVISVAGLDVAKSLETLAELLATSPTTAA